MGASRRTTPSAHRARAALCFSGGGIRSATFGLGVLQSLARLGLLNRFDYLSTVSGGGYIGSWLTAWIHRHPRGLDGVIDDSASPLRNGCLGPATSGPMAAKLQQLFEPTYGVIFRRFLDIASESIYATCI